jgi:hypothetical protein
MLRQNKSAFKQFQEMIPEGKQNAMLMAATAQREMKRLKQ